MPKYQRLISVQAWNTSGDAYTTQPGLKPWIAEM